MCCPECSFSPAGVIWRAGGFIVMWGNVICSSGGLFHRHCQLDISDFQRETGPWLEEISEQQQLSLQPLSVPSSVQVPAAPSGSWTGCWPWPASRGTWQWWSSWSWPTGLTRRATQSGRTSSLSLYACRCTRPSSQVGPSQASCESLCPVETRARPSHSPLALRWPAWSFAALFLASSSKDLRPPSFRRLPPARGFQCQGPTTADATPLGGAAEGKAPHKCSHWQAPVEAREATETFSSFTPFSFSFHVRVWPFGQPWHALCPECPEHSAFCPVGNEDIAIFLIRHGAFFCSYILLDSPDPSKHLLRKYFVEASALPSSCPGKMVSSLCLWMDG